MGYHRAGFGVEGVDCRPQPHYPFPFHLMDALEYLAAHGGEYDAIHASPPCQAFSALKNFNKFRREHPDLISATRAMLEGAGKPYVIENVPGAPLRFPTLLCGSMFGLAVRRHRLFEASFLLLSPGDCRHATQKGDFPAGNTRRSLTIGRKLRSKVVNVYGSGGSKGSVALWSEAMGIDWMNQRELSQAIPPAYTEFIGYQLLNVLAGTFTNGDGT